MMDGIEFLDKRDGVLIHVGREQDKSYVGPHTSD
jgi:hypothetical protein